MVHYNRIVLNIFKYLFEYFEINFLFIFSIFNTIEDTNSKNNYKN